MLTGRRITSRLLPLQTMRLVFTTDSFHYGGRSRPGFPLILGDDMRSVQPAQEFLIWLLLGRGKTLSHLTWEDYGRRMWDFIAFLHANELRWDDVGIVPGKSAVARYRDWSLFDLGLNPSTLNGRLRVVMAFYVWAKEQGLINRLPYSFDNEKAVTRTGLLAHVQETRIVSVPTLLQREWSSLPEFLSQEQVRACLEQRISAGGRLLFDLMVRVGLRSCEARTFPLKYVFNPRSREDCAPQKMIRIRLDPADMWIKFRKPRDVDIPYSLMQDLHTYTLYERNRLIGISGLNHEVLVLNATGRPYTKSAVVEIFKALSTRTGFRVRPLQLRHSYAIHTLARLRADRSYLGEPLLYVRDRMGHSSVQTTMVYLRQLEQLAGGVALAIEDEFNRMFGKNSGEPVCRD